MLILRLHVKDPGSLERLTMHRPGGRLRDLGNTDVLSPCVQSVVNYCDCKHPHEYPTIPSISGSSPVCQ